MDVTRIALTRNANFRNRQIPVDGCAWREASVRGSNWSVFQSWQRELPDAIQFLQWIREGVRQSVLLGVSDAMNQIGTPEQGGELHEELQLTGYDQITHTTGRKRLKSLRNSKRKRSSKERVCCPTCGQFRRREPLLTFASSSPQPSDRSFYRSLFPNWGSRAEPF